MLRRVANAAMILCAGLGTRLRPLTDELPKPLVPVGDRPVLASIAARLRAAGVRRAVVNTHHLAAAFASIYEWMDVEVQVTHEPRILGTAGGVAAARRRLGAAPVVVWNGDILASPPVGRLLDLAASGGLSLAVARRSAGEGTVGVDAEGHVVRLRGEVFGLEHFGGDYIGVAAVGARVLEQLPAEGCLIGDVALPELRRGGVVPTARVTAPWCDLGDPASYHAANMRWLDEQRHGSFSAPSASVSAGVQLSRSIVGAGAEVGGRGALSRVVVWPGAAVRAPLADAIVLRSGRVVRIR